MKRINFYRPYLIEKKRLAQQVLLLICVLGLMIVSFFMLNAFTEIQQKKWMSVMAQQNQQKEQLQIVIQALKDRPKNKLNPEEQAEVNALEKKVELFSQLMQQSKKIDTPRFNISTLEEISVLEGAWLTKIQWSYSKSKVHVEGVALNSSSAGNALEVVSKVPWNIVLRDNTVGFEKSQSPDRLKFEWIAGEGK